MRAYVVYAIVLWLKAISRLFYRHQVEWIAPPPKDVWEGLRIAGFLNHTSLYEWLYTGAFPNRALWRLARDGVLPVADKSLARPLVGKFFRLIAREVVSLTRQRDASWTRVLAAAEHSLIVFFPEGRMKRKNGLDKDGKKMTVRGGIADIVRVVPNGYMLLIYSGGLHHIQVPGEQIFPRLFKRIHLRLEVVDLATYRTAHHVETATPAGFKRAVVADVQRRRDESCPPQPQ